ncbi:MAG: hypothetical protein KBF63_10715 [Rhodoferax sp.]|jgi:hypothetical protein|nr:hypothetical protein [Rhodoferax sp.]MBP9929738.1 hypothetical protein [Rhodoferax sp.]HQZ05240.1 hypothetical protein [Burkholderiaceae bacterium]HRA61008.1 hypothetical protein [Burkholderiaceae bacterium]
MTTPTCAKVIYWRARPGQFDAYTDYLRNEVEPIDHAAQREGVLARFATLIDRRADAPWTHMRIFEFADTAQRDRLQEGLGAIMSAMLPDGQARAQRAQRASALRDKVGEVDMDLLG